MSEMSTLIHVYQMFLAFCYENVLLHHIDVFFKIVIQERSLDIHLSYLMIEMRLNV